MTSHIFEQIAKTLHLTPEQVARTVALFDEGNTVPFVARYRKEVTGGLDETQLRAILDQVTYLRHLDARKETVLRSIEEQGKLTDELRERILAATTLQEVEDLYLPYKPKRRTRATLARERGLEPLADRMWAQEDTSGDLEAIARPYLNDDVPTVEDAYAGARDILAERIAEDADIRAWLRQFARDHAWLSVTLDDGEKDPRGVYQMYYDYREKLADIPPHRLLAINRGEREGVLKVKVELPDDAVIRAIEERVLTRPQSIFAPHLRAAIADGYKRLLFPSITRELRSRHTEDADDHAIRVFARNLRRLLLQPPVRGYTVIGIDPGYRTGCKVAVVDPTGKVLETATIYPHAPKNQWDAAKTALRHLITRYAPQTPTAPSPSARGLLIAIGNGTASRETEALVAELLREVNPTLPGDARVAYTMVSESGASVYSASDLARRELPDLDVSMRGAVSIARRLQDPLAELVKIDPKSIGVGLYQHDVDQKRLAQALDAVVEDVVNQVGVDVNTASPALLQYVAGLNRRLAENIVKHRDAHGPFPRREALLKVKGMGPKTYEQAIGFLRIPGGENPLDATPIHPESYPVVERLFAYMGVRGDEPDLPARVAHVRGTEDLDALADLLEVGRPTLEDILDALARPGRDPREDVPPPLFRQDVLKMEDLKPGMVLQGVVRNVVDFGAFVDIGVKQDGLVHISELANRYVSDPFEVVNVGDVVTVRVLSVDVDRGRIALSMRGEGVTIDD
ncbi:MAG: RNA-binding transcriptional accessory protein [Chloroflexi bacterium]|nr:RNA-binding transcriptional accessory protein [Chloroflexota bacterium]